MSVHPAGSRSEAIARNARVLLCRARNKQSTHPHSKGVPFSPPCRTIYIIQIAFVYWKEVHILDLS